MRCWPVVKISCCSLSNLQFICSLQGYIDLGSSVGWLLFFPQYEVKLIVEGLANEAVRHKIIWNYVFIATLLLLYIGNAINIVVTCFFIKGIDDRKPSLIVHYIRMCAVRIFTMFLMAICITTMYGEILRILPLLNTVFGIIGGALLCNLMCAASLHARMQEELKDSPAAKTYGTAECPRSTEN